MKHFKITYLPDSVTHQGKEYKPHWEATAKRLAKVLTINEIVAELTTSGKSVVLVDVLSNSLKGKTDLYGNPYKATEWIFVSQ